MLIAVTGAAGYLGLNLVDRLLADGHTVRGIDRSPPKPRTDDGPIEWRQADALDASAVRDALVDVEVVFHLVARITLADVDPVAWQLNTEGVRSVADAALAQGVRRFIHCSSVHAYDLHHAPDGRMDETSPRAEDPALPIYDRSKWAGEQQLHGVIDAGLDAVICNPSGVYGPADVGGSRVNAMLLDAARGRVPAVVEGGFDFVDVRDVVNGLVSACDKGRTGENYLLPGHQVSMLELFRAAADATGRIGPLFAFPLSAAKAIAPIAAPIAKLFGSDVVTQAALASLGVSPTIDGTKARDELGHAPRPVEATVRDLVSYFVESGMLSRRRS